MIQKSNFDIYGSRHNRIFNNAESFTSNFPASKAIADLGKSGGIATAALPLLPSAIATDIAINSTKAGYEISKKALPAIFNKTVNATRSGINGVFGFGKNILDKAGRFLYRGTVETAGWPILRTLNNTRLSLTNWASNLPKDVLSLPGSAINAGVGLGAKTLSVPAKFFGAPLSWVGFDKVANFGEKLSKTGNEKMLKSLTPFQNTYHTLGDITNSAIDNTVDAGRANLTAWSGAINESWTPAINSAAQSVANAPRNVMFETREKMRGIMENLRPKHLKSATAA